MDVFKSRILILISTIALTLSADAQHHPVSSADSSSLGAFLNVKGQFHVHFRSFFMATQNAGELKDDFALAQGAGLSYLTPSLHGFQVGVTGFFIFDVVSSDLGLPDKTTKVMNRYEVGLFDITDPNNRKDLDRLEDLFIRYNWRKSKIEIGRFELNTPFINRQDGRMRGTIEEGAWLEYNEIKSLKIEGGWLWMISPRSTVNWYRCEDSYGVYPMGLNPDGTRANYAGNIESKGNALTGITWTKKRSLKLQVWNLYAENVFNAGLIQADAEIKSNGKAVLLAGVQYLREDAINEGGNENQQLTYFPKNGTSSAIGGRVGWRKEGNELTANYTRITADGRYLMPREWGRDPFYTFLPRERNDGVGDVHAMNIRYSGQFKSGKLRPSLAYGHYYLPDVKNTALNKYGLPSYAQLNAEVKYAFSGYLKGMQLQLLAVHKIKLGETYGENTYIINKVNMTNWNLVIDYVF